MSLAPIKWSQEENNNEKIAYAYTTASRYASQFISVRLIYDHMSV